MKLQKSFQIDDEKEIIDYFSDVEKLRYLYYNGNYNEMRNHINDITKKYPKETSVWYSVNTKKPCTVKEEFSLPEWEWMKKGDGSILDEKEITEANIQELIDQVGIRNGFKQEAQFKSASVHFALERYCEVVLDTGDIRYKK